MLDERRGAPRVRVHGIDAAGMTAYLVGTLCPRSAALATALVAAARTAATLPLPELIA